MQQRDRRHPCPGRTPLASGPRRRLHCPPIVDDRPKRLVRRFYEDVLQHRRRDVLRRLVGPEFIGHDSAGALMDRIGYVAAVQMLHDGFGELTVTIEDQIAERDLVTTRWTAVGRHTGAFAGIAPTGREVMLAGTDIHRVEGGRVAEVWEQIDFASLVAQLV